jgi:Flavin containing amine oxidoreductase
MTHATRRHAGAFRWRVGAPPDHPGGGAHARPSASRIVSVGVGPGRRDVTPSTQGNLHFAGEYISNDYQGYIEGGAVEGLRAANEIYTYAK